MRDAMLFNYVRIVAGRRGTSDRANVDTRTAHERNDQRDRYADLSRRAEFVCVSLCVCVCVDTCMCTFFSILPQSFSHLLAR